MDRIKDNISLDHMARLLVDVQQDSSGIVDSIISQHQRELLNLIFLGDAPNRNKVCMQPTLSQISQTQGLVARVPVHTQNDSYGHSPADPALLRHVRGAEC